MLLGAPPAPPLPFQPPGRNVRRNAGFWWAPGLVFTPLPPVITRGYGGDGYRDHLPAARLLRPTIQRQMPCITVLTKTGAHAVAQTLQYHPHMDKVFALSECLFFLGMYIYSDLDQTCLEGLPNHHAMRRCLARTPTSTTLWRPVGHLFPKSLISAFQNIFTHA